MRAARTKGTIEASRTVMPFGPAAADETPAARVDAVWPTSANDGHLRPIDRQPPPAARRDIVLRLAFYRISRSGLGRDERRAKDALMSGLFKGNAVIISTPRRVGKEYLPSRSRQPKRAV
ncbi:MAG: hypothetical protein DLM68_17590 [Hyphomicrobiales bacterium]|nr:MAG: hypothetical protein DLM68_17590 [Hyphomicrobiales bacterium]